ncbi:gfo/Idh/MocA family oxidoreductase [Cryobacterium melibiosiphilum]|uniref:Gfo/Idh/MocA family oxidoreductase n=1 Tax=Cryobacterium melibiosiphilum TaxID=995039 RepID=A0A3A5ML47_9MICO|nr:Gfo/Idh/MocA family oxidoreductase [Cryobacterium melibiosiphilum]RJT86224.1 gfo/Idh/MocA family oxidoreductase [Cryobacterium melibiosiphilum]
MTPAIRRVAVIGCGDISPLHVDAIAAVPGAVLVGVADPDLERRSAASAAHGVPGFADHLELFDTVRPNVVHICTPHHLHAAIAVDALERGIHVIVEKPLAHTRAEGARVVAAAERGHAKIAVCFQNRYNVPVQAAHDLLVSGELGAVLGASATVIWHRTAAYYESRPWRGRWATGGGGLLMNQAIHTLDLLQWLVGPVTAVRGSASTRALDDVIEVEDTAELAMTHQNGARSVFYATLAHKVNAPITVDIVAEHGTLRLRGDLTVTHADGRTRVVTEPAVVAGDRAYWGLSHELLIHDFYARLDDPEPFWISPREAQKTLEIIQDVYDQSYPERAHSISAADAAPIERNAVS